LGKGNEADIRKGIEREGNREDGVGRCQPIKFAGESKAWSGAKGMMGRLLEQR